MKNLITILGPTASGKSTLGIELAQIFDGEIISADSRQVFRKLDIGSAKVTKEEQKQIPHHLIDIVNPMEEFSVSHFQKLAFSSIDEIHTRKKLPFLVGGTALYIYSVIDNYTLQNIEPNEELRKKLETKSLTELQSMTPKNSLNNDDYNNPRRLIRAIEKLKAGISLEQQKGPQKYNNTILGIDVPREELYKQIDQRVDERIEQGMIEEVENLIKVWPPATRSLGEGWLVNLGLEYKFITEHLQGKFTKEEMAINLKNATHAFVRRQMTWFRRDKRIVWVKNLEEAKKYISLF